MNEETRKLDKDYPGIYWCNSHQREATHINVKTHRNCCDPKLGGILLPCDVVFANMIFDPAPPLSEKHEKERKL